MTILDKIIADKHKEVSQKKSIISVSDLEKYPLFLRETNSLANAIKNSQTGILAEHKRRSPSKLVINQNHLVSDVVSAYEKANFAGISVLTDSKYFGGSLDDLILARANTSLPLLRKEFIVDEYQIFEAKAHGADAILLIAAVLSPEEIEIFSKTAKNLGLDILLEVHDLAELEANIHQNVDMIGVNNRNLKTFEVSLDTSKALATLIPSHFVKISESGISSPEAILELRKHGFQGFLMGENFMKNDNILEATLDFAKNI